MIHELKIAHPFFQDIIEGYKTFEIRKNDRGFACGDILRLHEYDPISQSHSGEWIECTVTYITAYEQKESYVVMAFEGVIQHRDTGHVIDHEKISEVSKEPWTTANLVWIEEFALHHKNAKIIFREYEGHLKESIVLIKEYGYGIDKFREIFANSDEHKLYESYFTDFKNAQEFFKGYKRDVDKLTNLFQLPPKQIFNEKIIIIIESIKGYQESYHREYHSHKSILEELKEFLSKHKS